MCGVLSFSLLAQSRVGRNLNSSGELANQNIIQFVLVPKILEYEVDELERFQ
jgi:hypothetical protein